MAKKTPKPKVTKAAGDPVKVEAVIAWPDPVPPTKMPPPEPVVKDVPKEPSRAPWDDFSGSVDQPVWTDRGWSAGGHAKLTLCKSCVHEQHDGTCSGSPNAAMRADPQFTACSAWQGRR
jgi:hypothetical protein